MSAPRRRVLLAAALVAIACALTAGMLAWPGHTAQAEGPLSFTLPPQHGRAIVPDARDLAESAPGRAPLLVFLPATRAVPQDYTRFLDTAHSAGFSVLGLSYPNLGRSLAKSCGPDMACYGDMLANRFDGTRPTRFSEVAAGDGILARLRDALSYLTTHEPAGDWQRYRDGNGVRWKRVVLAGHSQGGGEAAYIAHLHAVRGVLMFSAPAEGLDGRIADWLSMSSATPASRFWGLDDRQDMYAARIAATWHALGIGTGAPAPLPTGAHGLITTLPLGDGGQSHSRIVSDRTPLDTHGRPMLEPVWRWMLSQVRR
ncbi:BPSS1187 family protein [Gryllotalpicola koreensis]|uniref:Alpha/beta hydrolase n=1 Tax=Gryllotalpicola koreensis TaxID=993086 RepID=A0ABP8A7H2_9MICO